MNLLATILVTLTDPQHSPQNHSSMDQATEASQNGDRPASVDRCSSKASSHHHPLHRHSFVIDHDENVDSSQNNCDPVNEFDPVLLLDCDPNTFQIAFNRVSSRDLMYEEKKKKPKFLGVYLMGDILGEGSYSKVKEVLDTKTLQRRAVKIMQDKRLRKIPNGEQNVQR